MKVSEIQENKIADSGSNPQHSTVLSGGALLAVRLVWAIMTLTTLIFFLSVIPGNFAYLSTPCVEPNCGWGQIAGIGSESGVVAAHALDLYAAYMVAFIVLFALAHFAVASVIALRKSNDWMALTIALFLITHGATFISTPVSSVAAGKYLSTLSPIMLGLFLYLFPDGRFVPRWTKPLGILWVTLQALDVLLPWLPFMPNSLPVPLRFTLTLSFFGTMLFSQIYRYRKVSGPVQRRQTKWVVYGVTMAITGFIVMVALFILLEKQLFYSPGLSAFTNTLFYLPWLLIPLSIGVAILRSGLYDIELIINRTLVYGSLTVSLALVYFGGVLLLEGLLRPLVGQGHNSFATVAATLLIVALFSPLRKAIQSAIDRRFYRSKYDATLTLLRFSNTLRDEVDLEGLAGRLTAAVEDTMQPSHVSLWLYSPREVEPER